MSNAKALGLPGLVASLFMLVLAPALWSSGPASAQLGSDLPATLWGTGLDEGVTVAASIGGTECGSTTVDATGAWAILVHPGGCGGGAVSGARVTFTVDGRQADQHLSWTPGYGPPDAVNGIRLTVGGGAPVAVDPVDPDGPPGPPRLSRTQGLAIFSGGALDDLEAAALAACPGGVSIWANEPSGDGYLLYRANAPIALINAPFVSVYGDGFDAPEPVIVTGCVAAGG